MKNAQRSAAQDASALTPPRLFDLLLMPLLQRFPGEPTLLLLGPPLLIGKATFLPPTVSLVMFPGCGSRTSAFPIQRIFVPSMPARRAVVVFF